MRKRLYRVLSVSLAMLISTTTLLGNDTIAIRAYAEELPAEEAHIEEVEENWDVLNTTPSGVEEEQQPIIEPIDIADCDINVVLDEDNEPHVNVTYQGEWLVEEEDYTCSIPSAEKDLYYPVVKGKTDRAYIAITGMGDYTGIATVDYELPTTALYALYVNNVSISLQGNIGINFYIETWRVKELLENHRLYVDIDGARTYLDELGPDAVSGNVARFTVFVEPKHISDDVHLRAYIENYDEAGDKQLRIRNSEGIEFADDTVAYSVADYIDTLYGMPKYSELVKSLVRNLKSYGEYAESYFSGADGDNPQDYIDEATLDILKGYAKSEVGELPANVQYIGSSLLLDSEIGFRHYFTADADVIGDYTFRCGDTVLRPQTYGNYYYIEFAGIPGPMLGTPYALEIYEAGKCVWSMNYSALSYVYDIAKQRRQNQLNALCHSIYSYYQSASKYFNILEDMKDYVRPADEVQITEASDFIDINGQTVVGRTVTGNNVAGKTEQELLKLAKTMLVNYSDASSYEREAEKWQYFTKAVQASGIDYNNPLIGRESGADGKYIGIYGGYKSDDIYIYYGDMTDGKRDSSSAIWMGERTSEYVEKDTRLTRYVATREYTRCGWIDDVPQGAFTTDYYFNIVAGDGSCTNVTRRYEGRLVNGYYDDYISWSAETDYVDGHIDDTVADYVDATPLESNQGYFKAFFKRGYIVADVLDSEGYAYVAYDGRDNDEVIEKIYAHKAYGLNGFRNIYTVSGNYVVGGDEIVEYVAPGVSIGNMNTTVAERGNGVSGNSVSGESISYNNKSFMAVSGNNTAVKYADILTTLAERIIAGGDEFSLDDWDSLVEIAKANSVNKSGALKLMLSDGNYAGIYEDTDGEYYLYHGSMSDWTRNGQGAWITAKELNTLYGNGKRAYGAYRSITEGRWIDDRPNGAFTSRQYTTIDRADYSGTILRTYSGSADKGAYKGVIEWTVESDILYVGDSQSHKTKHSYVATFDNGCIMGFNPDKEGYVYVPEVNTGYSEDKLYAYKQYGYAGVAMQAAFDSDNQRIIYPVSGNRGPVISGNYVSNNRIITETSTQEFDSIKKHYTISGNSVSSNVGKRITASVSDNHYDTDGIIDMAYKLVTSDEVDTELLSLFNEECYKGGLTYENPVMARYTDGYYIGVYGGYKDPETIYIYYGGTLNWARQGKGIWFSAKSATVVDSDGNAYECLSVDKTDAVWLNNVPQGQFTEVLTVTCKGPGKNIKNVRTYSGKADKGRYSGNIEWTVVSDSVVGGEVYKSEASYRAPFSVGYIQCEYRDTEGYTLVESTNGGYRCDKFNALKQYCISGIMEDGWDYVYARYMMASSNNAGGDVSANNVGISSNGVSYNLPGVSYTMNGEKDPWDYSVSSNKVILEATEHDMFSVSGNSNYSAKYATTDEMLLDYVYELVTNNDGDYRKWRELSWVVYGKGIINRTLGGVRNDGTYVSVYYDTYESQLYAYCGGMNNWKRSGRGVWMTVSGGLDRTDIYGNWSSYYAKSDRTECEWKNDQPDGDFTRTISVVLRRDGMASDTVTTYSGKMKNGAYDGLISWNEQSIYQRGEDVITGNHDYQAVFELGKVTGYLADNKGNVYIPSTSGGYTETCLSANRLYTLPGLKYKHTVSGNSVIETELADDTGDIVSPIVGLARDIYGEFGEQKTISIVVLNDFEDSEYSVWRHFVSNGYGYGYYNRWEKIASSDTQNITFNLTGEFEYKLAVTDKKTGKTLYSNVANTFVDGDMGEIVAPIYEHMDDDGNVFIAISYTGYMRDAKLQYYMYERWLDDNFWFEDMGVTFKNGIATQTWRVKDDYLKQQICSVRVGYTNKAGEHFYSEEASINRPYDMYFASGDISAQDGISNLQWRLSHNRYMNYTGEEELILSIVGAGAMKDLDSAAEQPWLAYIPEGESIDIIILDDNITKLGAYSLANMGDANIMATRKFDGEEVYLSNINRYSNMLPNKLEVIGSYAFDNFEGTNIRAANRLHTIADYAFSNSNIRDFYFRSSSIELSINAFNLDRAYTISINGYHKSDLLYWAEEHWQELNCNIYTLPKNPNILNGTVTLENGGYMNDYYEEYSYGYSNSIQNIYMYNNTHPILYKITWDELEEHKDYYVVYECSDDGSNWYSIDEVLAPGDYAISGLEYGGPSWYSYDGKICSQTLKIYNYDKLDNKYIRSTVYNGKGIKSIYWNYTRIICCY